MPDKPKKTININNVQYNLDDLSEKAKGNLLSLKIAEREITRLQQLLAMTQTARNAYAKVLNDELPKKDASGVQ